ncbi:MAG: hypothetical protein SXG53_14885 [Pseudomonadota bacterium]|nr:hypothetical protein [Pseudomonadota bacterium]
MTRGSGMSPIVMALMAENPGSDRSGWSVAAGYRNLSSDRHFVGS